MAFLDYTGLARFKNKLQQLLDKKSPLASPAFTGTPTAPTAAAGTDNTQIATTSFVMRAVSYTGDREFRGTYGAAADSPTITVLPASPLRGWAYTVVSEGLTLGGKTLNVDDMVVCSDPTATGDAKWVIIPTNPRGVMYGPSSSTDGSIPVFDGSSGHVLRDSGLVAGEAAAKSVDNVIADGAAGANLPTSRAVSDFVDGKILDSEENMGKNVRDIENSLESFVNEGYVENGIAYFTHDGDILFEITGIGGGGGGGGGGGTSTAVMTCTNTTGWTAATFAKGAEITLRLNWSSVDDEIPTGDGSLTVEAGESVKALSVKNIVGVAQGDVSVNVGKWMSDGTNVVRLTVTDVDGNARSKTFNINIQNLVIESSFDDSVVQTGEITFSYTPWGEVNKTIHFSVDGTELPTVVTTSSGRQLTNMIPAQAHGAHTLEVWFSAEVNENQILSNKLHYDMVCIETGNDTPIISSSYNQSHVNQYSTVVIPYMVYTPGSQVSNVTISMNGNVIQTLPNIDRTMHGFSHRFDDAGAAVIVISSGSATKTITMTIDASEITIEPVSENLALYLSARGRSNSEANPAVWTYGENDSQIACTMTGFDFVSNGWVQDDDGVTTLRVNGSASVTIPYQIFKDDFRASGKTIEIEFATRDVRDYSAVLLDCMSGGRGLQITAQDCRIASEQSGLQTQFKEDEHVRLAFVVDKRRDLRLIRCYVNGILSSVVQYPDNDDFTQINPADITISGNGNTVDIYCIRVYNADLTSQQIEENWIADTPDGVLMLERYSHNNVRDAYGQIVTSKLPSDLPYMIITASRLPQYKGDKLICSGRYVDPINPTKSFTFENAQIDVQGTSSQYYSRKNYKVKFNGGFTDDNGNTVSKYAMNADAIPVKTFCFKADVASSEGANNVELVRLYEEACPYRTPAQEENPKVRQGIDGFPMVIFWNNPDDGTTTFLGK